MQEIKITSAKSIINKEKERGSIFRKILSLKNLNKFLALMIIVGGVYYLSGTNDLTIKGFELQELNIRANKLTLENQDMESKITLLKSYNNLSERAKNINMVAVGEIDYISVINGAVAKK